LRYYVDGGLENGGGAGALDARFGSGEELATATATLFYRVLVTFSSQVSGDFTVKIDQGTGAY
jgi:hypothetical protein